MAGRSVEYRDAEILVGQLAADDERVLDQPMDHINRIGNFAEEYERLSFQDLRNDTLLKGKGDYQEGEDDIGANRDEAVSGVEIMHEGKRRDYRQAFDNYNQSLQLALYSQHEQCHHRRFDHLVLVIVRLRLPNQSLRPKRIL